LSRVFSLKNFHTIVFDFDGVLADTEEFCYKIHKDVNKTLTWKEQKEDLSIH
jgi:beta-phosphoglucomutase-like phosphatase (HAD superfamily)